MITLGSLSAIEWLFRNSIEENCKAGGDASRVLVHARSGQIGSLKNRQLVALNISSYTFRIVTLFDFSTDRAAIARFDKQFAGDENISKDTKLGDTIAELTNMICGSVNRRLGDTFRHAGMSTPMLLDHSCAQYISMLDPTHVMQLEVVIEDSVCFDLTICICVGANVTLDFDVDRSSHQESGSGEIELF